MVFNSYEFIFVFLPTVVVVFFALGKVSRSWALRWVIGASLLFYALWRPLNVLIIAPSVLINFAAGAPAAAPGQTGESQCCPGCSPGWPRVQRGVSRVLQVLEFPRGRS